MPSTTRSHTQQSKSLEASIIKLSASVAGLVNDLDVMRYTYINSHLGTGEELYWAEVPFPDGTKPSGPKHNLPLVISVTALENMSDAVLVQPPLLP